MRSGQRPTGRSTSTIGRFQGIVTMTLAECCPICMGSKRKRRFEIKGYSILECASCGGYSLGTSRQAIDEPAEYEDAYLCRSAGTATALTGYFDYEAELNLHLANFRQYLGLIRRHTSNLSLLDVGCASGHFLLAAARAGFKVKGLDISATATDRARALGFDAWTGDPSVVEIAERFDVITLWETIEHLANPDPVLQQIRRWLKPDGILLIGTGDNRSLVSRLLGKRWWYLVPPDHTVYYNPKALSIVLERNGFNVEGQYRILGHWVSSRNVMMKLLRSFQVKPARALKVAHSIPEVPLKIFHGTTIIAAARPRIAS